MVKKIGAPRLIVMAKKNKIQQVMTIYTGRLDNLREKYDILSSGGRKAPEEYHRKSAKIKYKLQNLRKKLRRTEIMEKRVKLIAQKVEEFTGWDVTNPRWEDNAGKLPRNLFYKYCMENGIQGSHLSIFCGQGATRTPSRGRMRFTRSFKTKKENLEMWHRFLNFMKENET